MALRDDGSEGVKATAFDPELRVYALTEALGFRYGAEVSARKRNFAASTLFEVVYEIPELQVRVRFT